MAAIVSLNVDYAATGPGHLDRAPCRVSMAVLLPEGPRLALDVVVRVEPLYDAMTPYTALSAESIRDGAPLEDAIGKVHALLAALHGGAVDPTATVVGHGLNRAAAHMRLLGRTHFAAGVDVVELTRTWNQRFEHWNFYALPKIAHVVLGDAAPPADSAQRAVALVAVYSRLIARPYASADAKANLQRLQYTRGFPRAIAEKPPAPAGVCVWAYNEDECVCDQPTLGRPVAAAAAAAVKRESSAKVFARRGVELA